MESAIDDLGEFTINLEISKVQWIYEQASLNVHKIVAKEHLRGLVYVQGVHEQTLDRVQQVFPHSRYEWKIWRADYGAWSYLFGKDAPYPIPQPSKFPTQETPEIPAKPMTPRSQTTSPPMFTFQRATLSALQEQKGSSVSSLDSSDTTSRLSTDFNASTRSSTPTSNPSPSFSPSPSFPPSPSLSPSPSFSPSPSSSLSPAPDSSILSTSTDISYTQKASTQTPPSEPASAPESKSSILPPKIPFSFKASSPNAEFSFIPPGVHASPQLQEQKQPQSTLSPLRPIGGGFGWFTIGRDEAMQARVLFS